MNYPRAVWHGSPNFRAGRRDIINKVVLHTTEGGEASSVSTLTDGNRASRVSAHYLVLPSGRVLQLVADENEAWHARDLNRESIGIEVVGWADRPATWSPEVVESLGNLVGWLSKTYRLPLRYRDLGEPDSGQAFVAHGAIDPSRRYDPGEWFPWSSVKAQAESYSDGGSWPMVLFLLAVVVLGGLA